MPFPSETYAEAMGYRVHHDIRGWYVVCPDEYDICDASGEAVERTPYSAGFDGRPHWPDEADAWAHAAKLALEDA